MIQIIILIKIDKIIYIKIILEINHMIKKNIIIMKNHIIIIEIHIGINQDHRIDLIKNINLICII